MQNTLLSLGLDLGTSTTQLVLSRLTLANRAAPFAVPNIAITEKEILYRSAVHFTPLLSETRIDADGVRAIVAAEYAKAGIRPADIQTGAVIITGETARKENARQVLSALAGFAGDCVVATAGPNLESVLAAKGAGVDRRSRELQTDILSCDVGGGTSNLAHYAKGELCATSCLNVGGRLVQVDPQTRKITRISQKIDVNPAALKGLSVGQTVTEETLAPLVSALADTLLVAAEGVQNVSFSGGVADCIFRANEDVFAYGDVGVLLGRELKTRFPAAGHVLLQGEETIRATVVGAGAHSAALSGSTVFYRGVSFPLKNLPVLALSLEETQTAGTLAAALKGKLPLFFDEEGMTQVAVALAGESAPRYGRILALAQGLAEGLSDCVRQGLLPVVAVEHDMGKALGHALLPLLAPGEPALLVLDGIAPHAGDYVDILEPAFGGAVLPVVIKTLAFES